MFVGLYVVPRSDFDHKGQRGQNRTFDCLSAICRGVIYLRSLGVEVGNTPSANTPKTL